MLVDLPLPAVRYAALLNTALKRAHPSGGRMVDWVRQDVGMYEQVGFDLLPWLVQWPHDKAVWALDDPDARLAAMRAQGFRSDFGSADDLTQVLDRYPDLATSADHYLLTYQTFTRESAPHWRWHKNGPYIGTQEPQAEHLGDEPRIDRIISWEVWAVLPEPEDLAGGWREDLAGWLTARMNGDLTPAPAAP